MVRVVGALRHLRPLLLNSDPKAPGLRGGGMSANEIAFDNVSKFYGEILGVNRVNLSIPPGVTSLVGPNGSGKTTLMNMIAGLLRPSRGRVVVCGLEPDDPEHFFRMV